MTQQMHEYLTGIAGKYGITISQTVRELIKREMAMRADDENYEVRQLEDQLAIISKSHEEIKKTLERLKGKETS